jgi:hypothetical protein
MAFRLRLKQNFCCDESRQTKIKIRRFSGDDYKRLGIRTISGDASEQSDSFSRVRERITDLISWVECWDETLLLVSIGPFSCRVLPALKLKWAGRPSIMSNAR